MKCISFLRILLAATIATSIGRASLAQAPAQDSTKTAAPDPAQPPKIQPGHLFDRVAVVGASASDGFGVLVRQKHNEAETRRAAVSVNMSDVLRYGVVAANGATTDPPASVIHHYASGFFFLNPGPVGRGEIDRALKADATLVVALDFLFWYVYGTGDATGESFADESARVVNLEAGLAQLDRVLAAGIPLVVGDIPDMHEAIGKMLSKHQVPETATIEKVNARLAQWVASRPGARMIALSTILAALKGGSEIAIAGKVWDPAKLGPLLQRDDLHPTFCGTVALAARITEVAQQFDATSVAPWRLEPDLIEQCVLQKAAQTKQPPAPAPKATPEGGQ